MALEARKCIDAVTANAPLAKGTNLRVNGRPFRNNPEKQGLLRVLTVQVVEDNSNSRNYFKKK
jgi:hypothetical protein